MTRPTFCRGTGQPSEKCDCLRCRPMSELMFSWTGPNYRNS